jgi:hypothetical protein
MTNPFAEAEAWSVGGSILKARKEPYLCKVLEVDGTATSSGGYPEIDVKVGNEEGEITDWIVVLPQTIGRVAQLTDALGVPRPTDDQVAADGDGFRLHPQYLAALVGKEIGVFVHEERDRNDPTRMKDRVKGYCKADDARGAQPAADWGQPATPQHAGSPGPNGTFFPPAVGTGAQNAVDDDIPF